MPLLAICAHCSNPIADEARFCQSCGSLVSDAEGQAAATAAMDQSSFKHMEGLLREDTKGEYTVGQLLGKGGMAVVYFATELALNRKVALKVLPPELTFGHGVERFKREAKTAAALDHPHIIPIYRISSSGKLFWYAMKYLEGRSLEDMLRERGSFSLDETVEILEQVADALDYAHEHQVIHRDIKPANVMLDNRDRVVVTDFGIAKALTEGKLTATDSVIGTPYFMSPEQGMGKTVTGASDQYSVAVMAYRMLAGHVPFDGDSAIDILHKHCMFPPPSLHEAAPHLPEHVCAAIERALSKAGAERFHNVTDFISAMKDADFVEQPSARTSVPTVMMDPDAAKKARSGALAAAAAKASGSTSPSAKTVAAKPAPTPKPFKTKAGTSAPIAGRAPVPEAPAPRSKTGIYVAAAVVVLAVGGFGAYKAFSGGGTSTAPTTQGSEATPGDAGTVRNADGTPSGGATVDPNPVRVADAGGTVKPPDLSTAAPSTPAVIPSSPPANSTANRPAATRPPPNRGTPPRTPATQQPPPEQPRTIPATSAPAPTPVVTSPVAASASGWAATSAILRVRVSPPAEILVNLDSKGERSTYIDTLRAGTHALRFQKEGFVTRDTTITVAAGETKNLTIPLQRAP